MLKDENAAKSFDILATSLSVQLFRW